MSTDHPEDWHRGAIEGDATVCAAVEPGRPDHPCILNTAYHKYHCNVRGRLWPAHAGDQDASAKRRLNADGTQVTVWTRDADDVTLAEPAWCTGEFHQVGGHRIDITHTGPPEYLMVPTIEDDTTLLSIALEQRPFTDKAPGRQIHWAVELPDGHHSMGPRSMLALADAMERRARTLRDRADQLANLRATGEQS